MRCLERSESVGRRRGDGRRLQSLFELAELVLSAAPRADRTRLLVAGDGSVEKWKFACRGEQGSSLRADPGTEEIKESLSVIRATC